MKGFTEFDFTFGVDDDRTVSQLAAECANALLPALLEAEINRRLSEAPQVFFDDFETMNADGYFEGNIKHAKDFHTHKAKLMAIVPKDSKWPWEENG